MRRVRIFVSSPGDAHFERARLARVVERLNGEFNGVAHLETIRWETEFYRAHDTFQAQIPEAAECDMVIAIFRARLGTELPETFVPMEDGSPYPSGTAYEVLSAIAAHRTQGFPDVYVFRYPEPPTVKLEDPQRAAIEQQWTRLKQFFDTWFTTPSGQFRAALQTFASTDDFETQTEALLRGWLEEKVLHGRSVVWPADILGSPFRGLAAFGVKHAPVFFGRSRDIAKALDRLKDASEKGCPFLLLNGASGAGKSSLARAGLVPRLTAPGVVPGVDVWRVAVMRPGEVVGDPITVLARHLFDRDDDLPDYEKGRAAALPELTETDFRTPEDLAGLLRHADATALKPLIGTLDAIGRTVRAREGFEREVHAALLLVVDQLDDLFGADITAAARANFVKLLAELAASRRVWIIATLRADLYERLLGEPQLRQLKEAGAAYDLAPPEASELAEIVRGPAQAADLTFDSDAKTGEHLDERLLRDADRPDLLPLLQFTLNQLFEARESAGQKTLLTFAAYRALGGLEGAVDKEAERAIASLDEAARACLPRLLRQLAAPARDSGIGGARGALDIHPSRLSEAAYDEPSSKLVRALVDARILLSSGEAAEATVRLAHARVLDSWQRARKIVAENADFYRIRAEVEDQRRRWESAGKSRDLLIGGGLPLAEAEKIVRGYGQELPPATQMYVAQAGRRARLRQKLLAAATIIFATVAGIAGWQWIQASRNAQAARQEKVRAEANFTAAKQAVESLIFDIAIGLGDLEGVRAEAIQKVLETVRETIERLAATAPNDVDLQRSRFAMFAKFGDIYARVGDGARALQIYKEALEAIRKLLAIGPQITLWRRDELVILERIADTLLQMGDTDGARRSHEEGLQVLRRLIEENPTSTDLQRDLGVTLRKLGDIQLAAGDSAGALQRLQEALTVARGLLARDASQTMWQNDLADTLTAIGDAYVAAGQPAEALRAFEEALPIARAIVAREPSNAKWQSDLTLALERIGESKQAAGDIPGALAAFEESLAIRRRLVALDPSNARRQRDLGVAVSKVAGARMLADDATAALALFEEALEITRKLFARDRSNTLWRRDYVRALELVGFLKQGTGDRAGAQRVYGESLDLIRGLAASDPGNIQWQRDLGVLLSRMGDIKRDADDTAGAFALYDQALEILRKVAARDPGDGQWRRLLSNTLLSVGLLRLRTGDRAGALPIFLERVALLRQLIERDRKTNTLMELLFALWNVSVATDDVKLKRASLEEALQIFAELDTAGVLTEEQKRVMGPGLKAELEKLPG